MNKEELKELVIDKLIGDELKETVNLCDSENCCGCCGWDRFDEYKLKEFIFSIIDNNNSLQS